MKKDWVVVWIVVIMLMAIGVLFSATSSQASDFENEFRQCNFRRFSGDQVYGVRLSKVSGKHLWFQVDLTVDPTHNSNAHVSVLLFDRNGNYNFGAYHTRSGYAPSGRSQVIAHSELGRGHTLSQVDAVLVRVSGVRSDNVFKFCRSFKASDVIRPASPPPQVSQPPAPPTQPIVAQDRGDGYGYRPPVVSIVACSEVANMNQNSPGPPRCLGRGGGKNGFWGLKPYILIHFKGLPIGSHKLRVSVQGSNREGKRENAGSKPLQFTNTKTGWWLRIQSPHILGKDYGSLTFSFELDHYGYVGSIDVMGSFE